MKKIVCWSSIVIALLLGIGLINFSLYEQDEDLFDFPIPKHAEIFNQGEFGHSYTWPKASEENGIPFGYEVVLWGNGWKKGERLGASVMYTKGSDTIQLISTHEQLDILRVDK
ncbi:hypothetical protein [Paucisalibacillus globulus]|uniref:hypothetical protein n=1 Tax=Paucisalibacillus globulus TaxID=351095 RepID=UPI000BB90668|nr:hypothetical protein [Paucisalibacillus globulus]